jgi:hypothetical protein
MTEPIPSLVERMAREAGFDTAPGGWRSPGTPLDGVAYVGEYPCGEALARYTQLVAEEAAKVCADLDSPVHGDYVRRVARDRANAIRERFGITETPTPRP